MKVTQIIIIIRVLKEQKNVSKDKKSVKVVQKEGIKESIKPMALEFLRICNYTLVCIYIYNCACVQPYLMPQYLSLPHHWLSGGWSWQETEMRLALVTSYQQPAASCQQDLLTSSPRLQSEGCIFVAENCWQ